jgi:hypothetical protein
VAVPSKSSVWYGGQQVNAATLTENVDASNWVCLSAGEGSQGQRYYDWTWFYLPYSNEVGCAHWLIARRSLSTPEDIAYYHAYAPATSTLTDLVLIAGRRWAIEVGFEQTKGELGLDQYECRLWRTWYRHIMLVLVAYAYLVLLRTSIADTALSIPEMRRLIQAFAADERERPHRLHWLFWRRRHQALAKLCHIRRRQQAQLQYLPAIEPVPFQVPTLGHLTEQAWAQIAALLPIPARVGRPSIAHRQLLEAILWVIHHGLSWHSVPDYFGPWETVYTRYKQWLKTGLWSRIIFILNSQTPSLSV